MDRRALTGLDISALKGLEFGPLSRPRVRKTEGDIYYLDHCSAEALRRKYPAENPQEIVEVDFIADGRPLAEITAGVAPFE